MPGKRRDTLFVKGRHLPNIARPDIAQHATQCVSDVEQAQHPLHQHGEPTERRARYRLRGIHQGRRRTLFARQRDLGQNRLSVRLYGQTRTLGPRQKDAQP